ncbi:hypothetical protein H2198_003923 [Neophaeococcomyces mojaviensis]|uniref:Uncharacterized protein n=1 Tax=Neophaeococcomyces mojaviensis TaxID=3383035 RepID=A0ACC3AA47_9EURO|nr:hypothetical protein H2198_003923 [Knufia sp. JES_112]
MALDTVWTASFPDRSRPKLYTSDEVGDDGFLPLTDANAFLQDDFTALTSAQLYALSANNAEALQLAQQEWTNLEKLALHIKNRDPLHFHYKDPQALPGHEMFEERKEATLYGYKYEANRRMLPARFTVSENVTDQEKFDCREPPEPFAQAGLIPNEKQFKGLMIAAKNAGHEKNPDSQTPYTHNFADLLRPAGTWIVKQMPLEGPAPYRTRAREGQLNGVAGGESRQTRFNGERVPPTRGLSEAPDSRSGAASPAKRAATPIGSPASKKRKIETVDVMLPRRKHPNQYTKRREAEEAARALTAAVSGNPSVRRLEDLEGSRKKHPNQYTKRREREEAERLAVLSGSRPTTPALARVQESTSLPRANSQTPDISHMTIEELRAHVFKDNDLINLIKQDYSWLNDDPAKALEWKNRILNAEYPVRTWAMLRKWKEWKSENKDKRPRNKVKDVVPEEVESPAEGDPKPVKRSIRLRARLDTGLASPQPSSPLVNGVNARDIDNRNNLDSLRGMDEPDAETKVGAWQGRTDLATSGVPQPKTIARGTEDELYPTSGTEEENADSEDLASKSGSSQEETSETESLFIDVYDPSVAADREYGKREQSQAVNGGEDMRRTRSSKSVQSSGVDDSFPHSPATRKLRSSNNFQQYADWAIRRQRGVKERPRNTEEMKDRQVNGHVSKAESGHWQLRR